MSVPLKPKLLLIGAVPPPQHGVSIANQTVAAYNEILHLGLNNERYG